MYINTYARKGPNIWLPITHESIQICQLYINPFPGGNILSEGNFLRIPSCVLVKKLFTPKLYLLTY